MQKVYLFSLFIVLTFGSYAQHCPGVDSVAITLRTDSVAIFSPPADSLACVVRGQAYSADLFFTVFTRLHGFTVDSLTIDSIGNMPAGLCWASNSPDNTFAAGQNGAIEISGQSYVASGQYKLQVYVTITTSVTTINKATLESISGLRYYMKMICPGDACPTSIDSAGGRDSLYIPYSTAACGVGIHEISSGISALRVSPDPFSQTTTVSFATETGGDYLLQLSDLLGQTVYTKSINATQGANEVNLQPGNLSSGAYIVSVSNQLGTVTQKVLVK